jgi:aryl-alcohol dehydrogenase-like predicted oxidoreductase
VTIPGARRPARLEGTVAAADFVLSPADLGAIEAILRDALPVWGPHPEGM